MNDQTDLLFGFLKPELSIGDIVAGAFAAVSIFFAAWSFLIQGRRSNELQRIEIYQRLEMASTEVFRYEAENRAALEKFRDLHPLESKIDAETRAILANYRLLEAGADPKVIVGPGAAEVYEKLEQDLRALRKYYEMTMNLFEVAARFRRDNIFEEEVFGSWTIWFYETCREWGFRWWWPDLRKNYMAQLRQIFDVAVETFQFEPQPGFDTRLEGVDLETARRLIDEEDARQEKLEQRFFDHVAQVYSCGVVAKWRENLREDRKEILAAVQQRKPFSVRLQSYVPWTRRTNPLHPLDGVARSSIPSPFLSETERALRRWA